MARRVTSKKIIIFSCVLCALVLLSGIMQTNTEVQDGEYYMETDPNIPPPHVMIGGDQIVFVYDYMSSNITDGTYVIDGNTLVMTTYDGEETYVFKIRGESLVFQKSKSSELKYVDEEHAYKVYDGAKFKLGEWVPE